MTFSILALDVTRTAIGVATASRSLAVGAGVPALDLDVGAAVSQAWTNRALRGLLLESVGAGASAEEAIARIPEWDSASERRQAAVLPLDGRAAAHTGRSTTSWAGHECRDGLVVVGNLLTGPDVLDAMLEAFDAPRGATELAGALVRALAAGERAGGDARGRQSAALLAGERGGSIAEFDLRVDDDPDPLSRLAALVRLRAASHDQESAQRD